MYILTKSCDTSLHFKDVAIIEFCCLHLVMKRYPEKLSMKALLSIFENSSKIFTSRKIEETQSNSIGNSREHKGS